MYQDPRGTRLRAHVMTMVDAMCWQRGQLAGPLPPSRGSGYGAWTMGVAPQPRRTLRLTQREGEEACRSTGWRTTIGPFSGVPAFLVRHILGFAGVSMPQGYYHRHAEGNPEWRSSSRSGGRSSLMCAAAAPIAAAGDFSSASTAADEAQTSAADESVAGRCVTVEDGASAASGFSAWGKYRWGEAPLPHLPLGVQGSAIAASCTDFWYLACGRPSPASRFLPW